MTKRIHDMTEKWVKITFLKNDYSVERNSTNKLSIKKIILKIK